MRYLAHTLSSLRQLPWPLLVASAGGWLLLAAYSAVSPLSGLCLSVSRIDEVVAAQFRAALTLAEPSTLALGWLTMLLAMMPPLLAAPLLHVWRRTLNARRLPAAALYIFGYAIAWTCAGGVLAAIVLVVAGASVVTGVPALVIAAVIALFWQATPLKQASLNRCHGQPPLAAFGLRAGIDVFEFGLGHGVWCAATCWALMLLPLVAEGPLHWIVMAAVMLAAVLERARTSRPARWGAAWPLLPGIARHPVPTPIA